MNTHLTVMDMMRVLKISPEKYNNFKHWCYRHQNELDTRRCVWNQGYYMYNVDLVRLKCPFAAVENADKVSYPETIETPVETPVDAAERLAAAINTATGQNLTAGDVLAAFERGKDYIRMRKQMARTLWRMRKARKKHSFWCQHYAAQCRNFYTACDNAALACDKRYRELRDNERVACRAAVYTMILFVVFAITLLTHIFMS